MRQVEFFLTKTFKQSRYYWPVLAGLILNGLGWFLIVWRLPASADWIPLYYNVYFGIGWIGPWLAAVYYPGLGLLILLLNFGLCSRLGEDKITLMRWLLWSAASAQFFILITIVTLIINYFS